MDLLEELIKIDSTNIDNTNRAIDFCAQYLKNNGIEGRIISNEGYNSYIATIGEGDRTLIFNGHLDVVSGNPEQFQPQIKEGKIIGRGAADMKGGVAAMINAFIRLKSQALPCKVMLQLVPDEEIGGKKGSGFLVEQGYLGDFIICTEPTNLQISIQTKGIINLSINTTGVSAHGCRPWEGVNAITKSFNNLSQIEKLEILNIGSEYYKRSSVNLGRINGGDILNRVPDKCTMGIDIRYVPHLNPNQIIEQIKEVVDGEVTVLAIEPGVATKPDNEYIIKLKASREKIIPGPQPELTVQHGGSDGRYFNYKGIPAVELGPSGNYWHGDKEYADLQSINHLEEILVDFASTF